MRLESKAGIRDREAGMRASGPGSGYLKLKMLDYDWIIKIFSDGRLHYSNY